MHFIHFVAGKTAASALWIDIQPGVAAWAIHAGGLSGRWTERALALGANEAIDHVGRDSILEAADSIVCDGGFNAQRWKIQKFGGGGFNGRRQQIQ
jgi:hypothetical protein